MPEGFGGKGPACEMAAGGAAAGYEGQLRAPSARVRSAAANGR